MNLRSSAALAAAVLVGAGSLTLVLDACSTADDRGADASADGRATGDASPGPGDAAAKDASPTDAADAGASKEISIPADGGPVAVDVAGGRLDFFFPTSAAGTKITIASVSPTSAGLPTTLGYAVLRLGPAGTVFDDPVLVRPSNAAAVGAMFTIPDDGGPGEGLVLSPAKDGFQLRHFSALVITPPGTVCDGVTTNDSPNSGRCAADGGATTFRNLSCNVPQACLSAGGACCVAPGTAAAAGCSLENQLYSINWFDFSSPQTPACDDFAGDWDGGDGGCGNNNVGFARGSVDDAGVPSCSGERSCALGAGTYDLTCDRTTCLCKVGQTSVKAFNQGSTCTNAATFRGKWVRECNFPLHK